MPIGDEDRIYGDAMKRDRIYKGAIPCESEGWGNIGDFVSDGIRWLVFEKPQEHSEEWFTYKIVAKDGAPIKASYWLARNNNTGQIGFARDFSIMRDRRPDLHSRVEMLLDTR